MLFASLPQLISSGLRSMDLAGYASAERTKIEIFIRIFSDLTVIRQ
jgi:hypothetical protein